MKQLSRLFPLFLLLLLSVNALAGSPARTHQPATQSAEPKALQCVAFSPYVGDITPNYGPQPSHELIDTLLDTLIKETRFRCIMTYGVLNGLDYTFAAAKARNLKVIAILWLDKDITVNTDSIAHGIQLARDYPDTIIKLSCGSEVRTRHGNEFDGEISRCISALREAKVKQPITTIDTWWEWCNRETPCNQTVFSTQVDWIGTNIFPWWENKHSGLHTCTTAQQAADFHIERLERIRKTNPGKEIIMTEFGWPNGPEDGTETNTRTGEKCGIASPNNQVTVIQSTLKKLAQKNWSGVVFEAFSENWKPKDEGNFGSYWGICQGQPPYTCAKDFK